MIFTVLLVLMGFISGKVSENAKEISLASIGLNEVAWTRNDALELLKHFEANGVFVSGGDLLSIGPAGFQHNYDNWYFDHKDGNARQSVEHTRSYINNYPVGDFVFVLVISQAVNLSLPQIARAGRPCQADISLCPVYCRVCP